MIATRPGAATRARMYLSTTVTFDGDLDYIAIEHAMNGEPVALTPAEGIETARQLDARGMNHAEIGRRIGCDRSTVTAWRNSGWKVPVAVQDPDPIDIGGATHGRSGYTLGCRCRTCKDGASAAARARRAKAAA
ncbi:hypothetical protein [Streptomyces sp. NPDC005167]